MKANGQATTREAILDATDRLLATSGYKKMTIEDLANEVGIGKGSVYLHFASKEDIVLSHIDRIIERLKSSLHNIAESTSDPALKLKEMLVERVIFRFDAVQHYSQSLDDLFARIRPQLQKRRQKYFDEEARLLSRVIDEGILAGIFACEDPTAAAHTMLIATNSLLPLNLSTRELGARAEIKKKVEDIADLMMKGLTTRN